MDEQATFETQAVLAPRRARLSRLALLVPVVALVGTAWAGLSGDRERPSTAALPAQSAVGSPTPDATVAPPSVAPEVRRSDRPSRVLGLAVQRMIDFRPEWLDRDEIVVLGGWFMATTVDDCPPVLVIRRPGELPEVHSGAERLTYCDRSGLLYDSEPDLTNRLPTNNLEDNRAKNAGLPAQIATILPGVRTPPELGVGGQATEVVVIGRFVPSGEGCDVVPGCLRELVIDHVAWVANA